MLIIDASMQGFQGEWFGFEAHIHLHARREADEEM
jgi:hypothetical protein